MGLATSTPDSPKAFTVPLGAVSPLWLAFAASLPPVVLLLASGALYTPWSWLPRIVMQFIAGALACAAVRKLRPSDRTRAGAGYLSRLASPTAREGMDNGAFIRRAR